MGTPGRMVFCKMNQRGKEEEQLFDNRKVVGGKQYVKQVYCGKTINETDRKVDFFILLILAIIPAFFHCDISFADTLDIREWKWESFWSRDAGAGSSATDEKILHDGKPTTRIEHRGERDWSLQPAQQFKVKEGDIFELSAWIEVAGSGHAELSVTTRDEKNSVVEWTYGIKVIHDSREWQFARAQFVIPHGVATILPRLTGFGPATIWTEGFRLQSKGNIESMRRNIAYELKIENGAIGVTFQTRDTIFAVTDKRTGQTWMQKQLNQNLVVTGANTADRIINIELLDVACGEKFVANVHLEPKQPEFTVAISSNGEMDSPLAFPQPFVTPTNTYLIVPMNEGISYPVTDSTIPEFNLVAYGGHGICMSFFGATDGEHGEMSILETADDAMIRISRQDGILTIAPLWKAQKGIFGYVRKIRYVFFDHGGHVVMCKRYRDYAREIGKLKTFTEKRRENPNIDLLIGAVNTWCWDHDAVGIVREMQDAGINRILWSAAATAEDIKAMNKISGVLTSRYDIYQDVMNPELFPILNYTHPDWPTEAWPQDLMLGPDGNWIRGWEIEGKDGKMHPCGVVCDRQAVSIADKRISEELKSKPYHCRFIDTTTAAPWRECYSPAHPLTRGESREWKMKLLGLVSDKYKLVCGSETGHDAAVPFADYFEGMLSLGPYRVPDAGRDMQKNWDIVPENISKFQLGYAYRLPLWELVYHDCVIAQWYWGDYNNKLPAVWDKRDLFNILYGTPPMFMFNRELWEKNKDRFVASFKKIGPVARATGYSEMLDHKFLTPDRSVQQTKFADGTIVTVNFSSAEFHSPGGDTIPPGNFNVKKP